MFLQNLTDHSDYGYYDDDYNDYYNDYYGGCDDDEILLEEAKKETERLEAEEDLTWRAWLAQRGYDVSSQEDDPPIVRVRAQNEVQSAEDTMW